MYQLRFLFIISWLITWLKSSSNPVAFVTLETSAIGLRSSCEEELQSIMIGYFLRPQDRHIFYSMLKSRYFDYSPVLLSICSIIDDVRLYGIISDLVEHHLPPEMIADCICISAKNGPWRGKASFPVNPLISNLFDTNDWSFSQIRHFIFVANENQSINTRWRVLLNNNNSEKLQIFFQSNKPWKMITASDISESSQAFSIAKFLMSKITVTDIQKSPEEFICKLILFSLIQRNYIDNVSISRLAASVSNNLNSILSDFGPDMKEKLILLSLVNIEGTRDFIEEMFLMIKPVVTPAIILNFLTLFMPEIETEPRLFNDVIQAFFKSHVTLSDVCNLLQLPFKTRRKIFCIINGYLTSRIDLFFGVFKQCPQSIPNIIVSAFIPFQLRLQTVLKKHRKLVSSEENLIFKLPKTYDHQDPREHFHYMAMELERLFARIDSKNFDVYNYPVLERNVAYLERKKSFIRAIDYFFEAFLICREYYHIHEDGTILPDLINLDPKLLETMGYFLGAAIVLQHRLKFRLNEEYFNLLKSSFKPGFHRVLFQIYPQTIFKDIPVAMMAKQLEIGVYHLNSGLSKALEAEYFTSNELYQLLFPLVI